MADSSGRPNRWLTVGKLVGALVAAGVLCAGLVLPYVGGAGLFAGREANKFLNTSCNLVESAPPEPSTIYASDGKTVIARIFTQDRQPVPLSQIPAQLQVALIDTEDRRFYHHHGVDMRGLIRSAFSTGDGETQGGSTLTMQYVKQVRYYNDIGDLAKQQADISQNIDRKMEDAQCAIQLEKHESKATILDNYFNIAFFGENAYSIQSAARTYFDVDVDKLTLPESAMLVGLLQAPSEYDPFQHPEAALQRRNQVLQNMVNVGDLSQADADTYAAEPIRLATTAPPLVHEGCTDASTTVANSGFFCAYAEQWLDEYEGITPAQLATGGYQVVTTLNAKLQNSTQAALSKKMPAKAAMTAVLPVLDPKSGDVLAMATNKLYGTPTSSKDNTHTETSVFTDASASGASTWKLFSLLTALQTGVPSSWSIDTYGATGANTKTYLPNNCYGATAKYDTVRNGDAQEPYSRNETLASGTAKSSNTFYVAMDDQLFGCSLQPIVNMARSLGMTSLDAKVPGSKLTYAQQITNNEQVLQLALGSGLDTSPLAMAGAYAAVANGGVYNAPAPIRSVRDQHGTLRAIKRAAPTRVVSQQAAAEAVSILQGDTQQSYGTSYSVFQNWYASGGSAVAGKTGTAVNGATSVSQSRNSALWFVGMTPNYVAASAVINPAAPYEAIPSLPGVHDPGESAYGDYASGLWLAAMTPTLDKSGNQWSWPDPQALPGLNQVPNIEGLSYSAAQKQLASQGLKITQLDAASQLVCAPPVGSNVTAGDIAYYGPTLAAKGDTITVCPSGGTTIGPYVPPPPPPVVHTSPKTSKSSTPGHGTSKSSPNRRRGRPIPTPPKSPRG